MKTKIARQTSSRLLIQRFYEEEDEIDDVAVISNGELLALMRFVKSEINGDWFDVIEYLKDAHE